jgi:hypothetical protein
MNWADSELQEMQLGDERRLEFQILFACARAWLKNSEAPAPRHLYDLFSSHSPDWRNFLELVHENRLMPVVYRALSTLEEPGIAVLCQALKQHWQKNSLLMLQVSVELARMLKCFSNQGIPVISFKGPALAVQIYGEVNMRFCHDLDLLVSPEHFDRAEKLMLQAGYAYLPWEVANKGSIARKPASAHTHFIHSQNRTHIELHFSLLFRAHSSLFAFDNLWGRQVSIPVANSAVPTLPLPLHTLYLAIHGEHHSWERLGRLFDIAAIIDRMNPKEIRDLIELADAHGQKACLMNALLLMNLLLGLNNIPGEALARMSNSKIREYMKLVLQITAMPVASASNRLDPGYWMRIRFRWTACRTLKAKLRYLAVFMMPLEEDIVRLSLPDRLYVFHYFLRPIWILKRKLHFLLRKLAQ